MAYIKSYKGQNLLISPNIKDEISEEHICFLVEEFVEGLDYSEFDIKYSGPGHPAYHPRILIKVLLQGMLDRVRSSRRLAKAALENFVYVYLSERLKPNFRTISDFRKANKKMLKKLFKQTVRLAQSINMISAVMICTDGSKIKANAGKKRAMKRESFELLDEWVQNEIEQGIAQDELEDEIEEKMGLKDKPKMVRREIKRIVKEYREKLKENPEKAKEEIKKNHQAVRAQLARDKNLKTVSLTDPESRFMKSKKGYYELAYNVQTSVDAQHGIIVANDVCQETTDTHQGRPQLEQAEQNLGPLPEGLQVCMDADYDDPATLKWLEDRKFDGYIPLAEKGGKKKEEHNQFSKKFFVFNETQDTFTCPQGKTLPYKSSYVDKNGHLRKYYFSYGACKNCPVAHKCHSHKEFRVITATPYEAAVRRMKAKMALPESKQVYDKRKEVSELAYAHLKHNFKFTEFLTRGRKTVKNEFNLACAANNLVRIWTHMKNTGKSIREVCNQISYFFTRVVCPA